MAKFTFFKYPTFTDGEIDVSVHKIFFATSKFSRFFNKNQSDVPRYNFKITLHGKSDKIGYIGLKITYSNEYVKYYGQISYGIQEAYRGRGYAAKGCKLIKQVAMDHHMDVIWIMCAPDNIASRKTCEKIGCKLVELIDLLPTDELFKKGTTQVCRYRWVLYP
jgi:predicted acetyltransferase